MPLRSAAIVHPIVHPTLVEYRANELVTQRRGALRERLQMFTQRATVPTPLVVEGRLSRMVGLTLEAKGCRAAVGDHCHVRRADGGGIETEVVGFSGDSLLLMAMEDSRGLAPDAAVTRVGAAAQAGVGNGFLGRVVDGLGRPLDGGAPPVVEKRVSPYGQSINPMRRMPIRKPLDVGVGCVNALLTIGQGQRVGLFAPSGAGKSMLLGMMTRYTGADVIVVGLIGERGREVQEFISSILRQRGLQRCAVVACPADDSPLMRVRGALLATSLAEHFRAQGRQVLLLMDSLTRFAQAQREIGLAVGEPPATRGYPPSVFARLPALVERAGTSTDSGGAITAIYTVLTEPDDDNDPIADSARAILDGHIVLSRRLAEQGHFPAIDVGASISRVMTDVTDGAGLGIAREFRELLAAYAQNEDVINVGAYLAGSDASIDRAIALRPSMNSFLRQGMDEQRTLEQSCQQLTALLAGNAADDLPLVADA